MCLNQDKVEFSRLFLPTIQGKLTGESSLAASAPVLRMKQYPSIAGVVQPAQKVACPLLGILAWLVKSEPVEV